MSKQDQINASLQQLDDATNEIANDLQSLRDQVAQGTVNDESLAKLDNAVSRLKALGQDPENPIPDTAGGASGNGDGSGAGGAGAAGAV